MDVTTIIYTLQSASLHAEVFRLPVRCVVDCDEICQQATDFKEYAAALREDC